MERIFRCDPAKREKVFAERLFDLRDMAQVFQDERRLEFVDDRVDHGEERRVTIGNVLGRIFTAVYTMRGPITWPVTAWPSKRKECDRYANR